MEEIPNYMTPKGHARMQAELDHLQRVERPKVTQEVADAAAQGDRSENAEYIYGKKRLREIDRRLRFLMERLKNVQIVDPSIPRGNTVFFGATVTVEDENGKVAKYQIVGVDEVDGEKGLISWRSPLGKALMRKKEGATVEVQRPDGDKMEYTILAVEYVG